MDSSQPFNRSYFGSEEFSLYTHYFETNPASATVVSSTLEVANVGDGNPGVVGLGPRSTLLQSLVDQSIISARTLGIYLGTSMPRANGVINGSLTWGGYDRGRFAGDVKSYDMDLSNVDAFPLTVQDVIISTADNETSTSLFDDSRFPNNTGNLSFVGRLSTDQYPISMPYQLTQNFKELLSARPSSLPDGSLGLTVPFNGTMTFV
ncbi:MAG: hypothetical protein INR71_01755, partial [Terriglobus roseus]|nr:hypothetical protein [Terriglobus roseus]